MMNKTFASVGQRLELYSPLDMPEASAFLWNKKMLVHVNCRGYVTSQYMNPEPEKYSHAPNMEARTFIQPEQPYYAHHPARFFYVRDDETGEYFSSPFKPCSIQTDEFRFSVGRADIKWLVGHSGIEIETTLTLSKTDAVELWTFKVRNKGDSNRKVSVYPYFTVGYMSWMNQSADYDASLNAIVCSSVTPYQKLDKYFENKNLKDLTFLMSDRTPQSWEARQSTFEGDVGLHCPEGLENETLENSRADYETPVCAYRFPFGLAPGEEEETKLIFGPALDKNEIAHLRSKYLLDDRFSEAKTAYLSHVSRAFGQLFIETPDSNFDSFVNNWLPRQVYYHGDINRLTTDPQTRNYLQDAMGMAYLAPEITKKALVTALSQQNNDGAMPDGVVLEEGTELKYINQVPHTDHCVWLPLCLRSYLDETADAEFLGELLPFAEEGDESSVQEHVTRAMNWLAETRDERGLIFIAQGDWCDPMNMVGYKGKGVSGWLTLAAAYAIQEWVALLEEYGDPSDLHHLTLAAEEMNAAVVKHLWDGEWFARGITDDGRVFGTKEDPEGRIFLNPQAWSILSGAARDERMSRVLKSVKNNLETPFGVELLSPAFTGMVEDVGRVTQKFPGSAENGSIYNHAAAFWAYALLDAGQNDRGFQVLRKMLPSEEDYQKRGQLPVFIPNYYRGSVEKHPRTAGRSSQMFNTGTVHWFYRSLVDWIFGLRGCAEGLRIDPNLPSSWESAKIIRRFRGALFEVSFRKTGEESISVNGDMFESKVIADIESGRKYEVEVEVR